MRLNRHDTQWVAPTHKHIISKIYNTVSILFSPGKHSLNHENTGYSLSMRPSGVLNDSFISRLSSVPDGAMR